MMIPSISLVLPAFNEEQNLAATVTAAIAALKHLGADYEIVIVDDGSTDATTEVCRDLIARHSGVRVIRHPRNRGYGAALQSGFNAARRDLVFLTDADGQFQFDQLSEFLARIGAADTVIGYRTDRQDRWHRKVNSGLGNWIARSLFELNARDINCAYKLLRREALRRLPLTCDGAMISTELLVRATEAGWRFEELPVKHFPRRYGQPTGAKFAVIWRTIIEFIKVWRSLSRRESSGVSPSAQVASRL